MLRSRVRSYVEGLSLREMLFNALRAVKKESIVAEKDIIFYLTMDASHSV